MGGHVTSLEGNYDRKKDRLTVEKTNQPKNEQTDNRKVKISIKDCRLCYLNVVTIDLKF